MLTRFYLPLAILITMLCNAHADTDTLRVALTGKYPPFSFYSEKGELAGFDVDVSKEVAKRLGRELEVVTTEWDGILAGLLAGKYDLIIGSMAITPERGEKVNFTHPYYLSGAQLFIHRDSIAEIKSLQDCAGRKLGVVLGETYEHFLRSKHSEIETVTYKSTVDIFSDIENGRLAGFVSDRLVGSWQIKKAGKPFTPAGPLLYTERIGIPVAKSRTQLLQGVNRVLAAMEADSTLSKTHDKWFGLSDRADAPAAGGALTNRLIASRLLKGFGITLLVAAVSLAIGFALAIPTGVLLNRSSGIVRFCLRGGVDFVRGTPVLIQLFFVYFGGPQVGLTLSPITAAILTLAVNSTAYMAEVVRSGLMSVDQGQVLAGRALGFSKLQVFTFIVWPQAFRIALPPLLNSVIALTKDTALISVISVGEVIREAQSLISISFNPVKYYLIVSLMFFAVTFPLMKLAGALEIAIRKRGFVND